MTGCRVLRQFVSGRNFSACLVHQRRARSAGRCRVEAIMTSAPAQSVEEAFHPFSPVACANALHERAVTLDAFFSWHDNRALYRLRDFIRIIGVDDQGLLEIFGRARKARQHQNARIVSVLGRDIFLCDQIHTVAKRRDQADVASSIQGG